ncbi:hypothetical protein LguiA_022373 [Lonicera macranthoides]
MLDYIPPEVMTEIMTRLPMKTLLQCTSVCKSWYSLIISPNFITAHLNRNNNSNQIVVRYFIADNKLTGKDQYSVHIDNEAFEKLETLEFPLPGYFSIMGSCNGLICLSNLHFMILWNPSVRKYVTLPTPSVTYESRGRFQQTIGFGFDSASNDYKVVSVVYLRPDGLTVLPGPKVELYELSTSSWRNINAGDFKYIISERDPQAFLDGVVHWTGKEGDGLPNWIVSFDMENEAFGVMMVPPSLQQECDLRVAVYGDSLSLIHLKVAHCHRDCCIWVMNEYGIAKSWIKQFTIDLDNGFLGSPFGFRENGDVLLAALHGNGLGDLVSYDPKSRQIKDLGICGRAYGFSKDTYMASLVLVKGLSSILERRESSCDAVAFEGASLLPREDDEGQGNQRMEDNVCARTCRVRHSTYC